MTDIQGMAVSQPAKHFIDVDLGLEVGNTLVLAHEFIKILLVVFHDDVKVLFLFALLRLLARIKGHQHLQDKVVVEEL